MARCTSFNQGIRLRPVSYTHLNVTEDWIMDKSGNKTYAKVFDIKQKGSPSSPICVIAVSYTHLQQKLIKDTGLFKIPDGNN